MTRKALSSVDTAWLRMEDPTNLMMISGVLVFGAPMDFDRLKAVLEHGLLGFDRFRQRVVWGRDGWAYWEDDPALNLDYHLQRIRMAAMANQAALQDVASELASTQLDLSRPLWQFHLVENYGEGSALICRLHHCIGDGLALVHVLLSLTSPDPDSPAWFECMEPTSQTPEAQASGPLRRMRRLARTTRKATRVLVREGMKTLATPSHAAELGRTGLEGTKALAVLVGRWPDPKTVFKGPLGVPKRTAWSAALPLKEVKAVGRALGGTINDVLLSAVAGGLRRYLQSRGKPVDGLNLRAIVPVNLRKPGAEAELGNKFSLVFLSLPLGIAEPVERLRELKRIMDGLKGSQEAPVAFGILNAIGMSPKTIQDIVVGIFGTKATAVMTNVVGPKVKLYLAGAPLDALMFWVPQSGHLGLGVSILSYAEQVWVGVITDRGLVPDPDQIVEAFEAEFERLRDLAGQAGAEASASRMAAMLDGALASLEEMGAMKVGAAVGPVETVPAPTAPCEALARERRPCKNPALPGSRFCRVHQGLVVVAR